MAADCGEETEAPSYARRLENALRDDSTEVLDDDLDLAPIDVQKTRDPHTAAYGDAVLKELRFDDPGPDGAVIWLDTKYNCPYLQAWCFLDEGSS